MEKNKLLCETEHVEYYSTQDDEIYLIRKHNGSKLGPGEPIENSMVIDILEKKVTKILPHFVYDYVEILESNGENLFDFCGD